MAIEWDIYLGSTGASGKISPFGRKTTIQHIQSVREARSANGTLKQDILYDKKIFVLTFAHITESALDTIDYWYAQYESTKTPLPLYMYTSDVAYDEYSVIPRPVDRTRVVRCADNLFSGVKFEMVEV